MLWSLVVVFIIFCIVVSLFFFPNSLYYCVSLVVLILLFLVDMGVNAFISTITILVFLIVYVGAMMVIVGYVCAVTPDFSSPNTQIGLLFPFLWPYFVTLWSTNPPTPTLFSSLADFFYSPAGALVFFTLVFMLFLTLIMVTSQYVAPKGPFRSV